MATLVPVKNVPQQQSTVVVASTTAVPQAIQQTNYLKVQTPNHQAKLRVLAIVEVVLGSICVMLGAAVSGVIGETVAYYTNLYYQQGYNYNYYEYRFLFTTGEGIWCGIWIVVAGALGVAAARPNASRCLINTHLAFSIVAAAFSGLLVGIATTGAIVAYAVGSVVAINSVICIIGFSSMILHIISASYCCATLQCCSCYERVPIQPQAYARQVCHIQRPGGVLYPQQSATVQYPGVPNVQQGYILHGARPMVQTTFPGTIVVPSAQRNQLMSPVSPPIVSATSSSAPSTTTYKTQEGLGPEEDMPPNYNTIFPQ